MPIRTMPEESDPPQPPPEDATIMMTPPIGGGPILPPASASLREVIGDFEIVEKIGQGGMGSVYRARQVSLDRQIALKILPAQMVGDEDAVARFRREARVASSLNHANLVAVYAAGEADGCHYIAMELIEGEDLGRRLKRDGKPTVPEALRICAEVTRGLDHGWRSAQLIHRDIKPANIFLAADGAVKLGDLGLAKTLGSLTTGLTQSGTMLGTPHYMSPEQARGDRELDFRADIYSLGCTLYQMLTGQVPYRGGDAITILRQHLDAPLPAIMKVWPQCPVPLARLVGRMLKKSRNERPASYAELLGQIESVWAQIDPVGYAPEAFAPPPRAAEAEVTAPLAATPPAGPQRPPQSKNLLYAGLAAGVLVLAIAAFVFWPKVEPLTKAQIIAAQRVAEASARARDPAGAAQTSDGGGGGKVGGDKALPSTPPLAAASTTGTYPQPRVWIDATEHIRWGLKDGSLVADGEWLVATKNFWEALGGVRSFRDSAVRVVFSNHIDVGVRKGGKEYWAQVWRGAGIRLSDLATHKGTYLKDRIDLGAAYVPDAEHELVFAAQGDQLSLWLDGKEVASVRDSTQTEGKMELALFMDARPAPRIKKVEYGELEAAGGSQAPVAPAAARISPSAEPWQDVLHDPAKLVLSGGAERTPEGLRFTDYGMAKPHPGQGPQRDGAVRMRTTFGGLRPILRARTGTAGSYQLCAARDGKVIVLWRYDNAAKHLTALREFPLREPLQPGQVYELELRVVGQTLTAKFGGEILGTVTDGTFPEGEFGVGVTDNVSDHNAAPALVKILEVLDLAAPAGASATPATATKDAPFVNGLGMKFVPVPIIGGPTGRQRVLFSVWETRVQDYAVFAKETKRELGKVNFPQEATHPALSVSWDDAQAFCTWLTERERKTGKLGAIEIYRLPSDHEWSCAVGLGEREDAAKTPAEKSLGIRDAYPWGSAWPPPTAAGNYSGEEAVGHENFKAQPILTSYRDDFPAPAPVGSFAANAFGIYDLGGNAWEWCEDWWDGQQQKRVQRGASFDVGERSMMWSSKRERNTQAARLGSTGFRIVVAPSAR